MSQELTNHGLRNRNLIEVAGDSSAQRLKSLQKVAMPIIMQLQPEAAGTPTFVMPWAQVSCGRKWVWSQ